MEEGEVMTKLVVGDIHGRLEIVEKVLASKYDVVFLGDFLDSYDRSVEDQVQSLRLALEAVEEGRAQSVVGNHELSYLGALFCSGWKSDTQTYVNDLEDRITKSFKNYIEEEGFLISHAGVSNVMLETQGVTLQEYLDNGEFEQVGYSRGGSYRCGGLYWCDWFEDFEPVEGVNQIVGHSGYRPEGYPLGILEKGGSYNVDCLNNKEEFLLIDNGNATIITGDDL